MNKKNILIAIIRNLIILLIATFVFSSTSINFPELLKGFFGDIFEYASPDVQKQVVSRLADSCSALDKGNAVTLPQLCANKSILNSMKQDCQAYRELQGRGIRVENEAEMENNCAKIESGEIDKMCDGYNQKSLLPDFSKIGAICKDYNNGKIDNKEFFYGVVSKPFSGQQFEAHQFGFLEKYNKFISYLNDNKIIYFIIITVLLALLYLLLRDVNAFLFALSEISFGIGMIIMLPYVAILIYDKFVGIDTTSILGSILGIGGIFDFKAILSLILLLFLRTYNNFIILSGIIFLSIGIIGKMHSFMQKRKTPAEKEVKIEDLFSELEQEMKKKK